uniref:Uncharacterized protein n=1 Tax=Rhizophora mucronata TaxID=61149 RepID=A0A2P2NLY4_RHIMU
MLVMSPNHKHSILFPCPLFLMLKLYFGTNVFVIQILLILKCLYHKLFINKDIFFFFYNVNTASLPNNLINIIQITHINLKSLSNLYIAKFGVLLILQI